MRMMGVVLLRFALLVVLLVIVGGMGLFHLGEIGFNQFCDFVERELQENGE